jgi:hypothetical protein
MATKETTTPAPEKKPRAKRSDAGKPKFEYFISNNGVPCRLEHFPTLMKKPIYVPCEPGEGLDIVGSGKSSRGKGQRLVFRCQKLRAAFFKAMSNPLFQPTDSMKRAKALLSSGDYKLEKRKIATESVSTHP